MPQRKNKAILIRTEEETIQNLKKFRSENKLSTYGEALRRYQTIAGSEVFLDYQECQFFSEYPLDSKHFIQCSRGKSGKRVPRKRADCEACAHNKLTKVLMESRAKIEQQNSDLQRKLSEAQHKLGDLNADIFKKTRESETITSLVTMPGELKKKEKEIADLRKHYENALREEQEKNKYLDDAYREMEKRHDELERQLENLQTVPKSVLEVQKPPIPQPQKTDTNNVTPPIQRITEREKTEKERIIETIATNPFTNREIQCPLKKQQYQDIMKECNKACSALAECPYWPDISRGTVPLGAKIRDKQEV